MNPIIGIVSTLASASSHLGQSAIGNTYPISITKAGGVPVILPALMEPALMDMYLGFCDGFLFSGGIDISPCFYGEEPHPKLGATNYALDDSQIPFMKKVLASGKPVLGICRGHQVLNVAAGGTLYQDLSEYDDLKIKHIQETGMGDFSHKVFLEKDSILTPIFEPVFYTNSYHHQAVKEVGPNVKIIARSQDQVVEAIQLENYGFGLGIQWHPEAMFAHGNESMRPIFEAFVQACTH